MKNLAHPMSGDSPQPELSFRVQQLASVLDQLACPTCLSALRLEAGKLVCMGCGRQYAVLDGIPVLIAEPK